ncbi:MAG TPA: cation diffusion facilitator family transporter [Candidatus Binatia bacterium]|jgi:cobalt-zinc-cadmium efflux system protein
MERTTDSRRLALALTITAVYFFAEVLGGLLTNSLALLSDAGHMFSDTAALGLSLCALQIARRPATSKKTFGYQRLEILAALINGLILWLVVGMIFTEAYRRFLDPPPVHSLGMLAIAAVGLAVNLTAGRILYACDQGSLNIRGAFLHVLGDTLGSVGAVVAALIMLLTGWYLADPIISILIGILILYTSWDLIRESVDILMQSVPRGINAEEVQRAMEQVSGVIKVHDLHVWSVTSGVFTLSAHAVIHEGGDPQAILDQIEARLKSAFLIEHTTIQLETEDREEREFRDF